jgi:hypothetical protein
MAHWLQQKVPNPVELFETLLMHSAVQLPFCIPSAVMKDRYQSMPVDRAIGDVWLDELAEEWIAQSRLGNSLTPVELIDILRQPLQNTAQLGQYQEIQRLASACDEPTVDECWAVAIYDLRDIPVLSENSDHPISSPGCIEDKCLQNAVETVKNVRTASHWENFAHLSKIFQEKIARRTHIVNLLQKNGYLLLRDAPGKGKSAMVAKVTQILKEEKLPVLFHMIKSQPAPHIFVPSLIRQGLKYLKELMPSTTADGQKLDEALRQMLARLNQHYGRVVLLIDGLDEMDAAAQEFAWLPRYLPGNVSVLLTSRPGEQLLHEFRLNIFWLHLNETV